MLGELQQHQFTPAKLRALAGRLAEHRELQDKLHDLRFACEAYTRWLTEHELQDADCLLDFATNALRSEFRTPDSEFRISGLWLDGFAEMTPQELDLLAAILPHCDQATLAFCLETAPEADAKHSWLSIWSAIGKTYQQCRQRIENLPDCEISVERLKRDAKKNRFAGNSDLAASGRKLVANPGAANPDNRPSAISLRQSPWLFAPIPKPRPCSPRAKFCISSAPADRFRDCAVLVRNLDDYHKPLARVFRRYEIPFFLDRRESVAHHPLAELTRSALRTVAFDWPHDDWFAALKAGFSPVDEAEIDRLENAALEFGWRGKKWREPFKLPAIRDWPNRSNGCAKKFCRRLKISPRNWHDWPAGRPARNSPTLCVNFGMNSTWKRPSKIGTCPNRKVRHPPPVTRHSIRPFGNK